jgi:hypothetical protein
MQKAVSLSWEDRFFIFLNGADTLSLLFKPPRVALLTIGRVMAMHLCAKI